MQRSTFAVQALVSVLRNQLLSALRNQKRFNPSVIASLQAFGTPAIPSVTTEPNTENEDTLPGAPHESNPVG